MPKREVKIPTTNEGQTEMTLQLWYRKLIFVFLFFMLLSIMTVEIFCNANKLEDDCNLFSVYVIPAFHLRRHRLATKCNSGACVKGVVYIIGATV